ncbi:thermostable hemolysin, partial [Vibrio diazotrophicus]
MRNYIYIEPSTDSSNNVAVEVNIRTKQGENTELLSYISRIYSETYNANVSPSPDLLVYTTTRNPNEILACAGVTMGKDDKALFSERYLKGKSLHDILMTRHENIRRSEIVEIGALASDCPKYASLIIKILPLLSWSLGFRVILCTATKQLRTLLKYYKIPFEYICESTPDVLTDSERESWGSYYENSPQLVFISLDSCGHLFNRYCGKLIPVEIEKMNKPD